MQQFPDSGPRAPPIRGGYTRQRQGCLTCRRRKKRCDRQYPICGHCVRLNLACEREEPRRVIHENDKKPRAPDVSSHQELTSNFPSQQLNHVARIYKTADEVVIRDELIDGDLLTSRRSILRYYTTVFAAMLTTNHENNCFLSVMVPMAFECPALMKSLVAWASTHLAARDATFRHTALRHRGAALSTIKISMDENELSPEMCLAVAMVFCSMDSISDREGLWYQHLLGGAAALGFARDSKLSEEDSSATSEDASTSSAGPITRLTAIEGGWLLQNFAYHDVLMSITLDSRPLLSGSYWTGSHSTSKADPYFGLASRIMYLIARVSELSGDLADADRKCVFRSNATVSRNHHELFLRRTVDRRTKVDPLAEAHEIESELFSWKCPEEVNQSPLGLLAETYRHAALVHLYRTLRRYQQIPEAAAQAKILNQVSCITDQVTNMPDGCLAECTLLFPLFMAGGEAEDARQIEIIREKLLLINKWRHFQNVDHALEVLDELWRLRSTGALGPGGRRLDWLDITKSRDIKLAIS